MPYTSNQRAERAAFNEFNRSLPSEKATVYVRCLVCMKVHKTYTVSVTALSRHAYRRGDEGLYCVDREMCPVCLAK